MSEINEINEINTMVNILADTPLPQNISEISLQGKSKVRYVSHQNIGINMHHTKTRINM